MSYNLSNLISGQVGAREKVESKLVRMVKDSNPLEWNDDSWYGCISCSGDDDSSSPCRGHNPKNNIRYRGRVDLDNSSYIHFDVVDESVSYEKMNKVETEEDYDEDSDFQGIIENDRNVSLIINTVREKLVKQKKMLEQNAERFRERITKHIKNSDASWGRCEPPFYRGNLPPYCDSEILRNWHSRAYNNRDNRGAVFADLKEGQVMISYTFGCGVCDDDQPCSKRRLLIDILVSFKPLNQENAVYICSGDEASELYKNIKRRKLIQKSRK